MESEEHSLLLKDGRTLAYHTFQTAQGEEKNPNDLHPVLYFHGYPGCGLEAGIACAHAVAVSGGRVYAIDRPGMGKTSSPYKSKESSEDLHSQADEQLETFLGNIWELVQDQGWKEFSAIGVSGGGPYVLGLLASYLRKKNDKIPVARLVNVCLVGGVIFSAGTEGMLDELVRLHEFLENARTSRWYRFQLAVICATMGPVYNYLLPTIPFSWTKSLVSSAKKHSPHADQEWVSKDENLTAVINMMQNMAGQGGYPGIYHDAMVCMRANHPHEEYLREAYKETKNDDLPSVGIFQGLSDANVPPSHAQYMHSSIFHEKSTVFRYENLGHESMIMGKPEDYATFACSGQKV